MSGESIPIALPISRLETGACEATALFEELRKPLLRYVACLGLSSDEAQDVVQETFLRLHRHVAGNAPRDNLRSWLYRVAHNEARNRQQSYDRRFGLALDVSAHGARDEATPERAILEQEKTKRLSAAIGSLTEMERECLLLRADGLRYREIGEVLGLATSTVADTVDRAVRKLAEKCNV